MIVMELEESIVNSVSHHSELHLNFINFNDSRENDQVIVMLHPK